MAAFGVLALQGDFEAHATALRRLGVEAREVRRCRDLEGLAGLVLPGGESTTLLNLMGDEPWFDSLRAFHRSGGRLFKTCAGAILLAREVRGPSQPSLGPLDVVVERNAYGRQVDSFEADVDVLALGGTVRGLFIRAPRFRAAGPGVEVLAPLGAEAVFVREGSVLAATFHPEIAGDTRLHRLFVESVSEGAPVTPGRSRVDAAAGDPGRPRPLPAFRLSDAEPAGALDGDREAGPVREG